MQCLPAESKVVSDITKFVSITFKYPPENLTESGNRIIDVGYFCGYLGVVLAPCDRGPGEGRE